jgi:hypothetical protein
LRKWKQIKNLYFFFMIPLKKQMQKPFLGLNKKPA